MLAFLCRMLFRNVLFSILSSRTCSLVTFFSHFISCIHLQHHILKLSKYFRSNFLVSKSLSHTIQCFKHNIWSSTAWFSCNVLAYWSRGPVFDCRLGHGTFLQWIIMPLYVRTGCFCFCVLCSCSLPCYLPRDTLHFADHKSGCAIETSFKTL